MRIWQSQREIRGPRAGSTHAIAAGEQAPPPYVVPLRMPRADGWADGRVWLRWPVDPAMTNGAGSAFGGYLAALADHALGLATGSVMARDEGFTTSELQVHFFRPVLSGELQIEAKVIHRGRSRVHAEVVFTRDDGRIAGKATATQVIIPLAPSEVAADR
ncbi:MAG: PaaI family thioesterase [Myxococcales bacterium]|nr:PaaI family thioesterase [Myxococcales bacterium]